MDSRSENFLGLEKNHHSLFLLTCLSIYVFLFDPQTLLNFFAKMTVILIRACSQFPQKCSSVNEERQTFWKFIVKNNNDKSN